MSDKFEGERLLRIDSVRELTGLSKSAIYSLTDFPKPIKISERASAWALSAVQRWISERITKAGQQPREEAREADLVEDASRCRGNTGANAINPGSRA